jgi:14-3-3 protein epsilon
MKRIAHMKVELTEDERNLLSVAYKNSIGSRRAAWRTLHAEEYKGNELIKFYEDFIEPEFSGLCKDILDLLNNYLIPTSDATASPVAYCFYYKMAGDYSRYQAEFKPDGEHRNHAEDYYAKAWAVASTQLLPTHPIRLGLALNYSVCYYEVLKQPDKAMKIAREAFDEGIGGLEKLDESDYKDATAILQLIRDNITLWSGGAHSDEAVHADAAYDQPTEQAAATDAPAAATEAAATPAAAEVTPAAETPAS